MGFIRRQLLKVIGWEDQSTNTIVYRYPMEDRDEIMNGCQLIVRPSQTAILVHAGTIADVFTEGSHKLETKNLPILTKILGWKYGFDSPFKAEVYFVNTKQFINQKWGTSSKINLRDADFGIVRVGGRGVYSYRVTDPVLFMKEIFGTNRDFSTESLLEYFKSIVVSGFSDTIGEINIPVLDIPAKYNELSLATKESISEQFTNIGLKLENFVVESVSLPEEVEKVIDKRSAMGIMSGKLNEYTQYQTAEAIRDAANNPSGGMAGIGVGLGAGVTMANTMMNSVFQNQTQPANNQQPKQSSRTCPNCNHQVSDEAKFCANCGNPLLKEKFCTNCGQKIDANAKFCPNCGNAQ